MNSSLSPAPIRILLLRRPQGASPEVSRVLFDEQAHFEVVESDDLAVTQPELNENSFHVVLVEIGARNANVEFLLQLRDGFPRLPVIAVVRSAQILDARAAIGDDAQDFLTIEQLSPETLAWSIHNALRRGRRRTEVDQLAHEIKQVDHGVRRMNRAVGRQYRRIVRLTESAGHDFRSSLTVVSEHAALVRDGICGDVNAEQKRMLTTACDRIDDLCRMIHDAESFSKLCAGQCRPQRGCCRVAEFVGPATTRLAIKAAAHGLTFSSRIEPHLAPVYCDPEMIVHILETLGARAINACSERGQVRVQVEKDPVLCQVRVEVGSNRADFKHPFRDAGNPPGREDRPRRQSFCLESAVAKELVDRNFGRLAERLGEDAQFTFDIPFAVPEEILGRYLNWLRRSFAIPDRITALRTRVEGCLAGGIDRAIDRQLNELARPDELLLRIGDLEWVTFIPARRAIKRRIQNFRTSLNQVRLTAGRATIRTLSEGLWSIDRQPGAMLEDLHVHELHSAHRHRQGKDVAADAAGSLVGAAVS